MASTYSTNLAIELIGTGDQAGSWGNTTNTNLGTLIEQAISGYVTQAVSTGTDTTITIPNGATGVARNMYIELTGTGGASTNLIVPANKKLYFIFNNTSSGQVTVKVSGQTGVSVPNKAKMILVSNGTDIVVAENYVADLNTNSLTVTNLTATSATITNLTSTSLTLSNNPTLNGGTANGVLYLNGSKVATSGSAVTYDGTTFGTTGAANFATSSGNVGVGTTSPASKLTVSGDVHILSTNYLNFTNTAQQTYIRAPASNTIAFGTSSTEQMRLDSSGNLGIGTTTPRGNLDVSSGSAAGSQTRSIHFGYSAADFYGFRVANINDAGATYAGTFRIQRGVGSSWSDDVVLNDSGNLGIGTSSPAYKLHVATNAGYIADFQTTAASDYRPVGWFNSAGSAVGDVGLDITNTLFKIRAIGMPLVFGSGADGTDRMRLDSSGNLGLGVTPSAWTTNVKVLEMSNGVSLHAYSASTTPIMYLGTNFYDNGTNRIYKTTAAATLYQQTGGEHRFFNAPSGTAGNTISFTQAMTLDASGRLGVATTSPVAMADISYGDFQSAGAIRFGADIGANTTRTNSTRKFGALTVPHYTNAEENIAAVCVDSNSTYTALHLGGGSSSFNAPTEIQFYTQAAINTGGGTERARITSGGNVGIATTSPRAKLDVSGDIYVSGGNQIQITGSAGSTGLQLIGQDSAESIIGTMGSQALAFRTGSTERARITSGGYFKASDSGSYIDPALFHEFTQTANNEGLQIRVTNASYGNSAFQVRASRNTTNNSYYYISCYNDGAANYRLRVADSGDVTNVNGTYGTISDAKMKTDIVDAGSQWDDIKAVRFRKFKMKNDPSGLMQLGVVAQELEQTSPGLVDEHTDKDDQGNDLGTTTKSVKTSVLLMKAAVALQEAMARIEQLEAKVAALESK